MATYKYHLLIEADGDNYKDIITAIYNSGAYDVEFLDKTLEEPDICSNCGCEIEEDGSREDEDGNILCEECFIQKQAKKKGLIKE